MQLLIIDDEEAARYGMRQAIGLDDSTHQAASLEEAAKILDRHPIDLILLDLNLGSDSGFDLLDRLQGGSDSPEVIVITAHGNERTAVEAMKRGAFNYLAKPFDIDELRMLVRAVRERVLLKRQNETLRGELATSSGYGHMIGTSRAMQRVYQMIERVADTGVTVLLTGESGSGKELVARELHRNSGRAGKPLVCVNCAAIPADLIESELFGHEKGSFTGATERRTGKFERADGGTLLLDEIGDMPLQTQAKILRVLEDGRVERLGGGSVQVDARILSATNKNLDEMVRQGRFREDLYYRLAVVQIQIPPLRERQEDRAALTAYFLRTFAQAYDKPSIQLHPDALVKLVQFPYPGNVRQLRNTIERIVVLQEGDWIGEEHLPEEIRFFVAGQDSDFAGTDLVKFFEMGYRQARKAFEIRYLSYNLAQNDNNITHTAAAIGIHRQSLQQKIKDLDLRKSLKS